MSLLNKPKLYGSLEFVEQARIDAAAAAAGGRFVEVRCLLSWLGDDDDAHTLR